MKIVVKVISEDLRLYIYELSYSRFSYLHQPQFPMDNLSLIVSHSFIHILSFFGRSAQTLGQAGSLAEGREGTELHFSHSSLPNYFEVLDAILCLYLTIRIYSKTNVNHYIYRILKLSDRAGRVAR